MHEFHRPPNPVIVLIFTLSLLLIATFLIFNWNKILQVTKDSVTV